MKKHTEINWTIHNTECIFSNNGCWIKDKEGFDIIQVIGNDEIEVIARAELLISAPEMATEIKYEIEFLSGLLKDAGETKLSEGHASTIRARMRILSKLHAKATN